MRTTLWASLALSHSLSNLFPPLCSMGMSALWKLSASRSTSANALRAYPIELYSRVKIIKLSILERPHHAMACGNNMFANHTLQESSKPLVRVINKILPADYKSQSGPIRPMEPPDCKSQSGSSGHQIVKANQANRAKRVILLY